MATATAAETSIDPKHPSRSDVLVRYETFYEWYKKSPLPEELAEAGFFYTGFKDVVVCHHCDGVLGGWEAKDDPLSAHEKYFPECPFLEEIRRRPLQDSPQPPSSSSRLAFMEDSHHYHRRQPLPKSIELVGVTVVTTYLDERSREFVEEFLQTAYHEHVLRRAVGSVLKWKPFEEDDLIEAYDEIEKEEKKEEEEQQQQQPKLSAEGHIFDRIYHHLLLTNFKNNNNNNYDKCVNCKLRGRTAVLKRCGHNALCWTCSQAPATCDVCPVCRRGFEYSIKTYISKDICDL